MLIATSFAQCMASVIAFATFPWRRHMLVFAMLDDVLYLLAIKYGGMQLKTKLSQEQLDTIQKARLDAADNDDLEPVNIDSVYAQRFPPVLTKGRDFMEL